MLKNGVCVCVTKLCVTKLCGGGGGGGGIQNQKQEPHTKMWGNKEDLRIVLGGYPYTNQHPTLIDFDPSQLDVGNGPSTDRSHRARGYGPGKREARAS